MLLSISSSVLIHASETSPESIHWPYFGYNDMIHIPYEIWDIIIHSVVSGYTDITLGGNAFKADELLPRWYLVPLLRVCKAWYSLAERYLYQTISVGSKFPHHISHIKCEPIDESLACDHESSTPIVKRNGREIAEDLLAALERNARLAKLVKKLKLGMERRMVMKSPECTRTHIRILQLCPNLEHVGIRDFHHDEANAVFAVLKEKMLLSFYESSSYIQVSLNALQIFELMQNWPQLKSIEIQEGWWPGIPFTAPSVFDASRFSPLCPELQTLIFNDEHITGSATLDVLCGCFNAWSTTLTCLKLRIREKQAAHQRINKAFSSLKCLRELHVLFMDLDMSPLSDLPHLRCLAFGALDDALLNCLEHQDKFPVLDLVRVLLCREEDKLRVTEVSSRRKIRFEIGTGYFVL